MPVRRVAVAVAVAAGALSVPGVAGAASPAAHQVYLVQGVPDTSVNVILDGSKVASNVATKNIVGPLKVDAGRHTVTFKSSSFSITTKFSISKPSTDVVVHWPADSKAKPEVTIFNNDVKPIGSGKGRVTVAHTAVVPPADIRVNGKVLFANIANGEFATADVPSGTFSVAVVPAGQKKNALLGPVDLPVKSGVLTRVFAIGAPLNGTKMDAIVQVLPLQSSNASRAPGSVHAGSAGLAAQHSSPSGATVLPLAGLGAALLLGVVAVSRRRRQG